jgi:predicted GTPase
VILWDGGNNDFSFYEPDLAIAVADPHRVGHELAYYPGEVVLRTADVVVIGKCGDADPKNIETLKENIKMANPAAKIITAESEITVDDPDIIKGKRVLIVEDGPTLTHGEMAMGAGTVAAQRYGVSEIIDPRPFAVGTLKGVFANYQHLGNVLPAMGYGDEQVRDLEATINAVDCDAVVVGTPIDLGRVCKIAKPNTRVHYELAEIGDLDLEKVLGKFVGGL